MRLNRYLAASGLGSRRGVETLIREGRVRINGSVVDSLSAIVQPGDVVKVGSQIIQPEEKIYAVLFKPRGFVCTADDERHRRTIFDLLPSDWPRVYHVGRLDLESEGLLIITNDGDLSLALTHPRFKIEKEYEVLLDKPFDPIHREKLLRGFHIEGGRAKIEELEQLGPNKLRLILNQGIKRQIRLMLYDCGYEVENLRRVRIGSIWIEKLRAGMWRMLSPKDVADLRAGRSGRRPKRRAPLPEPALPAPQHKPTHRAEKTPSEIRPPRPSGRRRPAERPSASPSPKPSAARRPSPRSPRPTSRSGPKPTPRSRSPRAS